MRAPLTDSHDRPMTVRAVDSHDENQSHVPSIANNSAMRQSGDTRLAVRRMTGSVAHQKMVNDAEFQRAEQQHSIVPVKMMDRPVTMADSESIGSRDRRADPCLGVAHGGLHVLAFGETGGNC